MTVKALVPAHFAPEIRRRLTGVPVELVAYDKDGVPEADASGISAFFRWWLSQEQGDGVIARSPLLRWIHSGSAGVDHILTPRFLESSIVLTNSSGVHAPSIAEWVIGIILHFEKDFARMLRQQNDRMWEKVEQDELSSKRIVLLGGGHIASAIATLLRPFGATLICVRKSGAPHELFDETYAASALHDAVSACDWFITAVPLSDETRHIVNVAVLTSLPRHARFINVARGEIVDQQALLRALEEGRMAGAALDVFEEEPLRPDHPFWSMENVLVLPHTTWRSPLVKERQLQLFCDNLQRFVRGEELLNVVDIRRGY